MAGDLCADESESGGALSFPACRITTSTLVVESKVLSSCPVVFSNKCFGGLPDDCGVRRALRCGSAGRLVVRLGQSDHNGSVGESPGSPST